MKQSKYRLLLTMLLLVVCVAGLTAAAQAADPVQQGDFMVAAEGQGGYTFDSDDEVLTITRAGTYTISMAEGETSSQHRIVVDAENVELVLRDVKIQWPSNSPLTLKYDTALRAEGTVTLASGSSNSSNAYAGIDAAQTVTFLGGTLDATGGKPGVDTFRGASGIAAKELVVLDGALTATGGEGSSGDTLTGGDGGAGVFGTVTIHGGSLTATGGEAGEGAGRGRGGSGICGAVTIYGGSLTATGGEGDDNKDGYGVTDTVTIHRGILEAMGGGGQQAFPSGPVVKEPAAVELRVGDSAQSNSVDHMYDEQIYAKYTVRAVCPITYAGLEGAVPGANAPTTHTEGKSTLIPDPTKANHHFAGWLINDGTTPVKALTLEADGYTEAITLTATWTEKELYPLPLEPQSYPYNAEPRVFVPTDTVTGVEYRVDGTWTEEAPVNAGHYDVRLTRAEDETYQNCSKTITAGLVITRVEPQTTPPVAKTPLGYIGQPVELLTAGSTTGGIMLYTSNGTDWSEDIPTAAKPGRYQLAWRVEGDANYISLPAKGLIAVTVDYAELICPEDGSCLTADFTDLVTDAWYHDGVHFAIESGLMDGTGNGKFSPHGNTTRAMLVTVLYRYAGSPAVSGTVSFPDVPADQWYTDAICWAAGEGIVNGLPNGNFDPNGYITREQFATILYRYAQGEGHDVSAGKDTNLLSYPDANQAHSYAVEALQWANGTGLITGTTKNGKLLLDPLGYAVRCQTATILQRFNTGIAE